MELVDEGYQNVHVILNSLWPNHLMQRRDIPFIIQWVKSGQAINAEKGQSIYNSVGKEWSSH